MTSSSRYLRKNPGILVYPAFICAIALPTLALLSLTAGYFVGRAFRRAGGYPSSFSTGTATSHTHSPLCQLYMQINDTRSCLSSYFPRRRELRPWQLHGHPQHPCTIHKSITYVRIPVRILDTETKPLSNIPFQHLMQSKSLLSLSSSQMATISFLKEFTTTSSRLTALYRWAEGCVASYRAMDKVVN